MGNEVNLMNGEENVQKKLDTEEIAQVSVTETIDGSSIYHYMKEHPGFFAALVSALVAIVAFVLNAAVYRRISAYLSYWGFNAESVQIKTENHIYILALSFVLIMALAGVTLFLNLTLNVFQKQENVLFYLKAANKYVRYEVLKLRFKSWGLRFLAWYCCKKDADGKRVAKLQQDLQEQNVRLVELKERTKTRRKTIRKLRSANLIRLLPSLLIAYGLMLLLLQMTGITNDLKAIVRYPQLALCLFVAILVSLMYFVVRFESRVERKRIKKMLSNNDESEAIKIEEYAEQNGKSYPAERIFKSKAEELFSNKAITFVVLFIIACIVYAFFAFSTVAEETTLSKKAFSVVDVDGQQYVITYACENTYYLNEIEINTAQNKIDIFIKKQRIIVSDDLVYEILAFSSVEVNPRAEERVGYK